MYTYSHTHVLLQAQVEEWRVYARLYFLSLFLFFALNFIYVCTGPTKKLIQLYYKTVPPQYTLDTR